MPHVHPVVDSDSRFVIDSTTREITTSSSKSELIQGDHQSERITFEIPKTVEGHDMSLCDRIEIHYTNTDKKTKATSKDVYIADDATVDGDKLTFTWLISSNATKYQGTLNFIIIFMCLDDEGNYTYKWSTEICKLLTVGASIYNSGHVVNNYSDVLETFRREVIDEATDGVVKYTEQELTEEQKAQARENIDAIKIELSTHQISMNKLGFTRENGTFSNSTNGRRTDYIPTASIQRIIGNAGVYGSCCLIAFYDDNKNFIPELKILGTELLGLSVSYGEGFFEIDFSNKKYKDAKFFVVSTYRLSSYTGYKQTFDDDYCSIRRSDSMDSRKTRLAFKSIVFFGDSITAGAQGKSYPEIIAEKTSALVTNLGISGSTLATGTSATHNILDTLTGYGDSPDIICISGGQNDANKSVPLGVMTNDYMSDLDTTTVVGALESIIRTAFTNYPSSEVYYIITHKGASTEFTKNDIGLTFADYHDAIVSVLKKYSIPFYDAFLDSGFITSSKSAWGDAVREQYTINADGVHPNEAGYRRFYVNQVIEMLEAGVGSSNTVENTSLGLTSVFVGQVLVVKTVDDSGKPLTWEAKNISDLVSNGNEVSY